MVQPKPIRIPSVHNPVSQRMLFIIKYAYGSKQAA